MSLIRNALHQEGRSKQFRTGCDNTQTAAVGAGILH